MNILIMGYGNIGRHVFNEFRKFKDNIVIYDKYKKHIEEGIPYSEIDKTHFDYGFICVPTDNNDNNECNTKEVEEAIKKANECCSTIIIKSAIPIGFCNKIHNSKIVYTPEYWGTTQHSNKDPNFLVVGFSDPYYANKVVQLYTKVKDGGFNFIFTDYKTAELAKYMENAYIATKVTFCNEFYRIADKFGVDYNKLRECFIADDRVNPSHTFVYDDAPYYDSHCLNKDIPALITQCKNKDYITNFLSAVDFSNSIFKINFENNKRLY